MSASASESSTSGESHHEPTIEALCEGLLAPDDTRDAAIKCLQEFLENDSSTDLTLTHFQLVALPEAYFKDPRVAHRLKTLWCSDNQLEELPPSLGSCVNLINLWCDDNRLERLPPELGACVNLEELVCDVNRLQYLPQEMFRLDACVKLRTLWCDNNRLRELPPGLDVCANLESLNCGTNELEDLPPELGACVLLKELFCDDNPLSECPPQIPQDLQARWALRPHTKSAGKE